MNERHRRYPNRNVKHAIDDATPENMAIVAALLYIGDELHEMATQLQLGNRSRCDEKTTDRVREQRQVEMDEIVETVTKEAQAKADWRADQE